MTWDHGGFSYRNHRCRCVICTGDHAAYIDDAKHRRSARLLADPTLAPHGRASTYSNWMCRCVDCTGAYSADCAARVQRRRSA